MNFKKHELELIRRDVLEFCKSPCNEELLNRLLSERGYACTQADLRAVGAWLAARGLISVRQVGVIQIFTRLDAAKLVVMGRELIEGIAEPEQFL